MKNVLSKECGCLDCNMKYECNIEFIDEVLFLIFFIGKQKNWLKAYQKGGATPIHQVYAESTQIQTKEHKKP